MSLCRLRCLSIMPHNISPEKKQQRFLLLFPDDIVLGSDTTVIIDHTILEETGTPERAEEMMRRLSGKTHSNYWSGACQRKKKCFRSKPVQMWHFILWQKSKYRTISLQMNQWIKQAAMAYKAMAHSWCKKSAVISTVLSDFLLQKPLGHWKNSKNNKSSCEQK